MQANSAEHYSETAHIILETTAELVEDYELTDTEVQEAEPTCFQGSFSSCMEMYAEPERVAHYLDAHRDWFPRCAHPMKAEPIGENGYALTIGKFGAFGYEVEPKVGLDLLPQDAGVYRIQTIAVPGYEAPGYDVDFRAALQLVPGSPDPRQFSSGQAPTQLTKVEWELDLKVMVQFPRFIHRLPNSLVQTTGDRLLNQIVRQVSRCLTPKVQEDFHSVAGIAVPKKRWRASR
ncbi:DUF1997 domain-containing protein [Phormidium tenue FACHB-886]|nr:DUF1997 domain-containing protein [Phormidium tenue FACHB-886]